MGVNDDFIRGNENLKKPNTVIHVSETQQQEYIQELMKCKEDIVYFAEKFFTIISPAKGKHLIELYPKQKKLLRAMVDEKRLISLASRQVGKTTTYTIYALHQTIFYPEQGVLIAANKKDTALEILGRIQMAYECLPGWLKPGLIEYNKGKVKFSNLSTIQGVATGSSSARGSSAKILILDEFSFVPNNICREFWNSVYPVISSSKDSKVIVVSTPNGVGNLYHSLWEKSQSGEQDTEGEGWKGIRIDWYDVPGRDEAWKKQQIEALGQADFDQEFGNSFLSSSTPKLISDKLIQEFRTFAEDHEDFGRDISLEVYQNKEFKYTVYHEHMVDRSYLISFDVGNGVGVDASVAYVFDVTDMSNIVQCAKFSDNKVATNEFSYIVYKMYEHYGRCWIAGEANSIGKSVFDLLIQLYGVENFVSMNKGKPGILSHAQIKSKACRFVKNLLSNPSVSIKLYDENLINEMEWFVQKDTVKHVLYHALQGKHDDHMLSFIWGLYTLNDYDIENYFSILQYVKTPIGETLPLYIQSLLNTREVNTDTVSILDLAWRKQKEKDDEELMKNRALSKPKLEYFDKKPTQPGILGKMELLEKQEDGLSDGLSFFIGGHYDEW